MVLSWMALWMGVVSPAVRAQFQGWTAHTAMRQVTALTASPEALWAATTGGVFRYDPANGAFQRFSPVEGLHSVQTQAIAFDPPRRLIWIGYPDGVLDRLDVATGTIRTFRDIERADQFSRRGINRIRVQGDSILVATDFGLVVFDPVREEVRDTYSRLGDMDPATPVFDVLVAPIPGGATGFWLAADQGVAFAPLHAVNLQDPGSWTVETAGLGPTEPLGRSLAFFNDRLYLGGVQDLYVRGPDATYSPLSVSANAVTVLAVVGDRLLGVERFNLLAVEATGAARRMQAPGFQDPTSLAVGPGGTLWFGDREAGLVQVEIPDAATTQLTVRTSVFPEGPFSGQFSDLTFGAEGSLWAGGVAGTGFFRLDREGRWTSFFAPLFPELAGLSRFTRVHVDVNGNAWAGSEGSGLVQVSPEGNLVVYNQQNSSLIEAAGAPDFIIVGGVASDPDGTLWVTTRGSSRPLHVRSPDGEWTALSPLVGDGLTSTSTAYDRIYVDAFEEKWIIVRDERNFNRTRGLAVLDDGGTPTDAGDDAFRFFNAVGAAGQGLPSVAVTSVVEDREGLVWIGTEGGLAYFINTGIVARDPSATAIWPQWADRARGTFVLFGLEIHDLAVDPANRLWVATNEGAWLIEAVEGGYELVQQWTTDNSPLFSDNVVAVAVDGRTGRVYFATDRGLLSVQGDALAPAERVGDLFIFPNPVLAGEGSTPDIFIEGLVEETEVRVVAPHGAVVARFRARGGRIRWDGRDLNGQPVPSGVYLVVAVGQNDEGTAYGKVAVIR